MTQEKKSFSLGVKSRRPLWQDLLLFAVFVGGAWGALHVGMNWSAYSQIIAFKANNLQASVLSIGESEEVIVAEKKEEPVKPKALTKSDQVVFRNRSIKPRNQAKDLFDDMSIYPSDNRVVIPRIGKNVPLVDVPNSKNWTKLEASIQNALRDGVVVHPISQDPTQNGNFFVTGHSSYYSWDPGRFKDVFALLHEVKVGDTVEVYWHGKKYVYKIEEEKVVPPTEVSVLDQPDDKKELTLMTCTPVGTNKNRLILKGTLVEG